MAFFKPADTVSLGPFSREPLAGVPARATLAPYDHSSVPRLCFGLLCRHPPVPEKGAFLKVTFQGRIMKTALYFVSYATTSQLNSCTPSVALLP